LFARPRSWAAENPHSGKRAKYEDMGRSRTADYLLNQIGGGWL
jgi:hypothetical protein